MTQIAQGAHAYIFQEPGQAYRVQADDVATVQVIYGAPSALITLTAQSQTFGPYDSPAKLKVSANTAACEYTLIRAHYAELTQQQLAGGAVGVLASNNAGGAIEPDGDVPSLGGGGSSVTVVNDLTTGGTTAALSAEMGKTLQTNKLGANADAIADVLEAAATGAPTDLARIQSSVSGAGGAAAARLRAAYSAAVSGGNPLRQDPWVATTAWAATTAYNMGQVVVVGSSLIVAMSATGTSGASAPSVPVTGATITDGTVSWSYYGPAGANATLSGAPTVTVGSNPFMARYVYPVTYPDAYSVFGGSRVAYRTNFLQLTAFNSSAGVASPSSARVGFETDAQKFAILNPSNGAGIRVIVEGRYLQHTAYNAGGSDSFVIVDFGTASPRRTRRVIVETSKSFGYFGYVQVGANDTVAALSDGIGASMAFIGDSYLAGSAIGPALPGGQLHNQVAQELGILNVTGMATGGTGYVATNGGANYNFLQRVQDAGNAAKLATQDLICIIGSPNDFGQSGISANVTATLTAIRAVNPYAPICVIGVASINNAAVAATEAAVAAGVSAFTDQVGKTYFFPFYGATPLPWLAGSWNNSGDSTYTNAGLLLSVADPSHPIDLGTAYIAKRIAQRIASVYKTLT